MYHHGGNIYDREIAYDFSVNLNPMGMPDTVRAFLQSSEALYYAACYPQNGNGRLAEAIAQKESVRSEQVVCGNGASELLYAVLRGLPRGKVFLCAPCFSEYAQAADVYGWRTVYYETREETHFQIQGDILGRLEAESPDLVILCNPSNPVGNCINPPLLAEILEYVCRHNIRLLADECFLPFLRDGEERTVKRYFEKARQAGAKLMVLKAFTKVYGMAGLRLGYLLLSEEAETRMFKRELPDWNVSSLAQQAGILALAEDNYLAETRRFVRKERERVGAELTRLGFKVYRGLAGFLFWKGKAGLKEALLDKKLLIRECNNYTGLSAEDGYAYYRTAIRSVQENNILLDALAKCR